METVGRNQEPRVQEVTSGAVRPLFKPPVCPAPSLLRFAPHHPGFLRNSTPSYLYQSPKGWGKRDSNRLHVEFPKWSIGQEETQHTNTAFQTCDRLIRGLVPPPHIHTNQDRGSQMKRALGTLDTSKCVPRPVLDYFV